MATTTPALPESLPPHELRNLLRTTLRRTLAHMDSDEFQMELDNLTEPERKAADITRGETYRAWRRINNQQLDEIRNQLVEHEADLLKATHAVSHSLDSLAQVTAVIDSANKLLSVVSRLFMLL